MSDRFFIPSCSERIGSLCQVIDGHTYIINYDKLDRRADALRQLGVWASNPELNFGWYNAAVLSQEVRGTKP